MITRNMLGCYKSIRDEADYLIKSFLRPFGLPEKYDLTRKMTRVRSQGQEGSCVGFAMVTGVKEYQEQKDYSKFIELSPRFLYEKAKKISGHTEGTTLKAAVEVAYREGVCEEKFWPYIPTQTGTPQDGAETNALNYRVASYARITNLEDLKRSIFDEKIGVSLIGVNVYKGMISEECKRTGIVPNPSCWDRGKVLGGHALCAVGWVDNSAFFENDGHIKVKNSWGESFGDRGYLYLSYKYIKSNMIDAFATVDIDDPADFTITRLGSDKEWER